MARLTGIDRWNAKIRELESNRKEVLYPILVGLPENKRIEYCKLMINNIKNDESNHLTFGKSKKK